MSTMTGVVPSPSASGGSENSAGISRPSKLSKRTTSGSTNVSRGMPAVEAWVQRSASPVAVSTTKTFVLTVRPVTLIAKR